MNNNNKKWIQNKTNCRGSYTVEASVLVPIIILIMVGLIFSFIFILQKVMLTQIAIQAAEQGAQVWTDSRKSMETGVFNRDKELDSLYYQMFYDSLFSKRIFDETFDITQALENKRQDAEGIIQNGSLQDRKIAKIRLFIYNRLNKTVFKPDSTRICIEYDNKLISRKLTVSIIQTIPLPMNQLVGLFGGKNAFEIRAEGISQVIEPAELIRNVDLLRAYRQKLSQTTGLSDVIDNIKSKLKP